MGKIPTLVHRGVAVTEAAAICVYLAVRTAVQACERPTLGKMSPT
jgi:glutathione S-transferase